MIPLLLLLADKLVSSPCITRGDQAHFEVLIQLHHPGVLVLLCSSDRIKSVAIVGVMKDLHDDLRVGSV